MVSMCNIIISHSFFVYHERVILNSKQKFWSVIWAQIRFINFFYFLSEKAAFEKEKTCFRLFSPHFQSGSISSQNCFSYSPRCSWKLWSVIWLWGRRINGTDITLKLVGMLSHKHDASLFSHANKFYIHSFTTSEWQDVLSIRCCLDHTSLHYPLSFHSRPLWVGAVCWPKLRAPHPL